MRWNQFGDYLISCDTESQIKLWELKQQKKMQCVATLEDKQDAACYYVALDVFEQNTNYVVVSGCYNDSH